MPRALLMMKNRRLWFPVLVGIVATAALGHYAVRRARAIGIPTTNTLTYSGMLYTFGQPDNATHSMSAVLLVGGSVACAESPQSVTTTNGQFTLPLSSTCQAVIQANQNVEVQISIDGAAVPATPVTAVPYAVAAATVDMGGVTGVLPVANGGTGSSTASFVPQTSGTGAAVLPTGTTAQRPSSPANGLMRLNTTTGCIEVAYNNAWTATSCLGNYTATVLIVAGGGGGGSTDAAGCAGGGGGGAGGLETTSVAITPGNTYSGTVGGGGSGGPVNSSGAVGSSGVGSSFNGVSTTGGGGGGGGCPAGAALNGGSGGGGGNNNGEGVGAAGTGISGQGFNGGVPTGTAPDYGGGGGGGAGGTGGNGNTTAGGVGGAGVAFDGVTYAGGGGGSTWTGGTPGAGGAGGGGSGAVDANAPGAGQPNTGGGGGGAGGGTGTTNGGSGGSGVVLVTYPGPQRGTGGTVTYNATTNITTHAFTTVGSFTYGG